MPFNNKNFDNVTDCRKREYPIGNISEPISNNEIRITANSGKGRFDSHCPADIESAMISFDKQHINDDKDAEQYIFDYGDQNSHLDDIRTDELITPTTRTPSSTIQSINNKQSYSTNSNNLNEKKRSRIKDKFANLFIEKQTRIESRINKIQEQRRQREQRYYYRAAVLDIIGSDYTSKRSEEVRIMFIK